MPRSAKASRCRSTRMASPCISSIGQPRCSCTSTRPAKAENAMSTHLLAVLAIAGPLLSVAPGDAQPQDKKGMNHIDAHVHVWTPDTTRYPLAPGFKKENMKPASFTPEELFKHCKPAGVGRINLIQMSFYGFDNSYMLDAIARYPDVFVGTAVINPLGKDPAREMDELAKKGVRAFRIHPKLSEQPAEKWLRPEGYKKMFT